MVMAMSTLHHLMQNRKMIQNQNHHTKVDPLAVPLVNTNLIE